MHGTEWLVEAHGCDPVALRDPGRLQALFDRIVDACELKAVAPAVWHVFPDQGGVTGVLLLAESHLACHTFPEYRSLCLNLFCCRARPDWDASLLLAEAVGATITCARRVERDYGPLAIPRGDYGELPS